MLTITDIYPITIEQVKFALDHPAGLAECIQRRGLDTLNDNTDNFGFNIVKGPTPSAMKNTPIKAQTMWQIDHDEPNNQGITFMTVNPYANTKTIIGQITAELHDIYQQLMATSKTSKKLTFSMSITQALALRELATGVLDNANPFDVSANFIQEEYHLTPNDLKSALANFLHDNETIIDDMANRYRV